MPSDTQPSPFTTDGRQAGRPVIVTEAKKIACFCVLDDSATSFQGPLHRREPGNPSRVVKCATREALKPRRETSPRTLSLKKRHSLIRRRKCRDRGSCGRFSRGWRTRRRNKRPCSQFDFANQSHQYGSKREEVRFVWTCKKNAGDIIRK